MFNDGTSIARCHHLAKNWLDGLAIQLVKSVWCQTLFCQESLTKNRNWVENKDNYLSSLKMKALNNLAGALALTGALAAPVEAQEADSNVVLAAQSTAAQVIEQSQCGEFVAAQRVAAEELGMAMTRAQVMALVTDCTSGALNERIAEQELILAALDEQIRQYDLRLDEQARIIDANNREIARIVTINGQLIIRRTEVQADTAALNAETEASRVRQEQMLQEAERILQSLATS